MQGNRTDLLTSSCFRCKFVSEVAGEVNCKGSGTLYLKPTKKIFELFLLSDSLQSDIVVQFVINHNCLFYYYWSNRDAAYVVVIKPFPNSKELREFRLGIIVETIQGARELKRKLWECIYKY